MKKSNLFGIYSAPDCAVEVLNLESGILIGSYYEGGGGTYGPGDINDNGQY